MCKVCREKSQDIDWRFVMSPYPIDRYGERVRAGGTAVQWLEWRGLQIPQHNRIVIALQNSDEDDVIEHIVGTSFHELFHWVDARFSETKIEKTSIALAAWMCEDDTETDAA